MSDLWDKIINSTIHKSEESDKLIKRIIMAKSKKILESGEKQDDKRSRNFVAKHMNKFNKPKTHKDKKNSYQRKGKHNKKDMERMQRDYKE